MMAVACDHTWNLSAREAPCKSYGKERGAKQHGALMPPPTFPGFIGIATISKPSLHASSRQ
ncbi:hypothetical protein ACSFA0_24540 [Variovorax sp. LT1P1]|uniref:hypothetical protein n=1 Tax=Variovorax sp. LT1P1 TaxID=3443730 RepID=UPI003F47ACDF